MPEKLQNIWIKLEFEAKPGLAQSPKHNSEEDAVFGKFVTEDGVCYQVVLSHIAQAYMSRPNCLKASAKG